MFSFNTIFIFSPGLKYFSIHLSVYSFSSSSCRWKKHYKCCGWCYSISLYDLKCGRCYRKKHSCWQLNAKSFWDHLNHLEKMVCSGSESEGAENIESSLNYISSITCPLRHYCYSSFEPKYYLRRWSRNYFRFLILFFFK
jgi:hypothetical protein